MNGSLKASEEIVGSFFRAVELRAEVDICFCPPHPFLAQVGKLLGTSNVSLGAQNIYHEDSGAYTGEVSVPMVKELGCRFVLVGHSERRQYFGETNALIARKVAAVSRHGLIPVLCVGENLETRLANRGEAEVLAQVQEGLSLLGREAAEVVIAYEPVWAIGTGQAATPEQAASMLSCIRSKAQSMLGDTTVRLLYGGSVTPENAAGFFAEEIIGGVLAGGISLKGASLAEIVRLAGSNTYV